MTNPNQGITKTQRGEEQPADKDRAQAAQLTKSGATSPSTQATRKDKQDRPSRSGASREK